MLVACRLPVYPRLRRSKGVNQRAQCGADATPSRLSNLLALSVTVQSLTGVIVALLLSASLT
jgi:hypothetical protein